jgi:CheY-like chemotaxis protein
MLKQRCRWTMDESQGSFRGRGRSALVRDLLRDLDKRNGIPSIEEPLRVLVSDDNEIAARALSTLVTMWGHDVRMVHDGAAALELAFAYGPHVLLLDVTMPKMDGCRLAQRLRDRRRFRESLLIAITGHSEESQRVSCEAAGFDLLFVKPIAPSVVQTLLMLERTRLRKERACRSAGLIDDFGPASFVGAGNTRRTNRALRLGSSDRNAR